MLSFSRFKGVACKAKENVKLLQGICSDTGRFSFRAAFEVKLSATAFAAEADAFLAIVCSVV